MWGERRRKGLLLGEEEEWEEEGGDAGDFDAVVEQREGRGQCLPFGISYVLIDGLIIKNQLLHCCLLLVFSKMMMMIKVVIVYIVDFCKHSSKQAQRDNMLHVKTLLSK